ncbi:hypothetical protein [Paraburkholderia diazotrophica]|uniref:hypothetical protein n=1 Tax=Paraburkholderia diazotrophica TaxID=667676 RepID=UPI00316BE559
MNKLAAVLLFLSITPSAFADQYVHGYTRRDGTYVNGYHRTEPDYTRNDNYSTRGNFNPYTGEPGHAPRDEDYWGSRSYGAQDDGF